MRLNTFTCSEFSYFIFTKKNSFDPKNWNNCKKLVIIQLMPKLAVLLCFLGSEMIFFSKLKKNWNMSTYSGASFLLIFLIKWSFDFNIFSTVECSVIKLNVWIIWRKYTFKINGINILYSIIKGNYSTIFPKIVLARSENWLTLLYILSFYLAIQPSIDLFI